MNQLLCRFRLSPRGPALALWALAIFVSAAAPAGADERTAQARAAAAYGKVPLGSLGLGEGPRAASLRAVVQEEIPVVVDADALNNLAELAELQRDFHAHAVLTPHPGEYRRLAGALGIDADPVKEEQAHGTPDLERLD